MKFNETILLIASLFTISSCENDEIFSEKYVVIWQNYDGTILEIDRDVEEGSLPTYDGNTPTKPPTNECMYLFSGWSPSSDNVTENIQYTATFLEIELSSMDGGIPSFSNDLKTVTFGIFPQSNVTDQTLIESLNLIQPSSNGWYLYQNSYYAKVISNVYSNESYTFNSGASITNNLEYWFKCEPIEWNILESNDREYKLIAKSSLFNHVYDNTLEVKNVDGNQINPSNYKESSIRNFLNNDFYNKAFCLNNVFIKNISIDNSATSTESSTNIYACDDTTDKVYLPSYKDLINVDYGFDSNPEEKDINRAAKTTDYMRATGAWYNNKVTDLKYYGTYYTRSPSKDFYYCVSTINSSGHISTYAVDGSSNGIRPCITIQL